MHRALGPASHIPFGDFLRLPFMNRRDSYYSKILDLFLTVIFFHRLDFSWRPS